MKYDLPNAPRLGKAIGPSIVLLGLGLGTGELILWPYLVSNFGLGIIWAAIVGILMQYFINIEIERYSLIKGESIFVGFNRYFKAAPFWFIFSTFIPWIWPGIIASSGKIFGMTFGFSNYQLIAILLLILIGIILSVGKSAYKNIERFQKVLIIAGVPIVFIIVGLIAKSSDWVALGKGILGAGHGYAFIPQGLPIFTFLGALAYSGAGGNLNLAQSLYIKEKGYGMCKGTKSIGSVLLGKSDDIDLEGNEFDKTPENYKKFNLWWRLINREHFLIFFLTGAITILILALLSFASTAYLNQKPEGIAFMQLQIDQISLSISPFFGKLFGFIASCMLFATSLTVLDSTSRIISENLVLINRKFSLVKLYYVTLWTQIIIQLIILSSKYSDPLTLVIVGAVLNAFAMFFHISATLALNLKSLDKKLRPNNWRLAMIIGSILVFGILSVLTIINY